MKEIGIIMKVTYLKDTFEGKFFDLSAVAIDMEKRIFLDSFTGTLISEERGVLSRTICEKILSQGKLTGEIGKFIKWLNRIQVGMKKVAHEEVNVCFLGNDFIQETLIERINFTYPISYKKDKEMLDLLSTAAVKTGKTKEELRNESINEDAVPSNVEKCMAEMRLFLNALEAVEKEDEVVDRLAALVFGY